MIKMNDSWHHVFDFEQNLAKMLKEHQKETESTLMAIIELKDMLDEVVRFHLATESLSKGKMDTTTSLKLFEEKFSDMLQMLGLEVIDCMGQKPDPNRHHIAEVRDNPNSRTEMIVDYRVKGYLYKSRLLRRPSVIVEKAL